MFDGFGEERAIGSEHAFDFAAAEPEPAEGIEVAAVAHAVPDGGRAGDARLDFNRYGNRYCLSKVWNGERDGIELPKSKLEREIAREARQAAPVISIAAVPVQ